MICGAARNDGKYIEKWQLYKMNIRFTQERRGQKKPREAKRSPKSFLKESCIGSIRLSPDLTLENINLKIWG
jgi:hypothetical protein